MYIVFDIGGTRMRMATSIDGENLNNFRIVSTPKRFEEALLLIKEYVSGLGSFSQDNLACFGIPGILSKDKSSLIFAPNLPDWVGKPIKDDLGKIINTKEIFIENDASLAALGEASKGAGRDYSIVAFLTVGTGVGGARIVKRFIDVSGFGFEPGHQIVDVDRTIDEKSADFEGLVSGSGLLKRLGKLPQDIKDKNVWEEVEKLLAVGFYNTILFWSPEVLVVGGGIFENSYLSLDRIKLLTQNLLKNLSVMPEIKKGELGDKAGLVGGLVYIKQKFSQLTED